MVREVTTTSKGERDSIECYGKVNFYLLFLDSLGFLYFLVQNLLVYFAFLQHSIAITFAIAFRIIATIASVITTSTFSANYSNFKG